MIGELAFFSFVELTDQTQHRAYNEWHQLDHRPENLALPGVAWGDRWARTPEHKQLGSASPEFAAVDYTAMYWFREPLATSLAEWGQLAEDSFQWGRGPIMPGVKRPLLAFFRPGRGYSAPRVLVSPDVLPFRPNRGLHVTLSRFTDHHSLDAHAHFTWEDRVLIPSLLDVPGVAGAWTFSFSHHQQHPTMPFNSAADDAPGSLRMRLLYLDDDPLTVTPAVDEVLAQARTGDQAPPIHVEQVLFSSPVKTIVPWQDW